VTRLALCAFITPSTAYATCHPFSPGFANSVSLLARYVAPTGTVQAAIQVAATLGSMTFPPAVALIAQRGVVGVRSCNGGKIRLTY
jgi:hypothetical protein